MYSAPKNALEQRLIKTSAEAGQPANEQDRISYGIVTEVKPETSQVKVRLLTADGEAGDLVSGGFLPLINALEDIHMRFGALRKGLVCRIFWRGKLKPKDALIEIIGDEEHSFLQKKPAVNLIEIGPYAIFSGGVGG